MSIVAAFGDDDHTAADGPFVRVMKVRKWLYIFGAGAFVLSLRLYDDRAVHDLLKVIELPSWLLVQLVAASTVYLLLQYGLLGAQLFRTYDIVLNERLAYRRADELAKAAARVASAQKALEDHRLSMMDAVRPALESARANLARLQSAYAQAQNDRATFEANRANYPAMMFAETVKSHQERISSLTKDITTVANDISKLEARNNQINSENWDTNNESAKALSEEIRTAELDLQSLKSQDPADRPYYRHLEVAVDLLRIVPPPLFALSALLSLLRLAP